MSTGTSEQVTAAEPEALTTMFAATGVPERLVPSVRARLGAGAADRLRADPWRLLTVPGVRPEQADHFAGRLLGEAPPDDVRRTRALVEHLLTRAAGDGHVVVPARTILKILSSYGVGRPADAVEAALETGEVLVLEPLGDSGDSGDDPDAGPFEPEPASADALGVHGVHGVHGDGGDGARDRAGEGGDGDDGSGDHVGDGRADGGDGAGAGNAGDPAGPSLGLARYALAEESLAEAIVRLAATVQPLQDEEAADAGTPDAYAPGAAGGGGGDGDGPELGAGAHDGAVDGGVGAAVRTAARHGVSVVDTGPGDGARLLVRTLAAYAAARGARLTVAAPTTRAARTLGEASEVPVHGVHELLTGASGGHDTAGDRESDGAVPNTAGPTADAAGASPNAAAADIILVTGAAALGVEPMAALADACPDGTRLVVAGDPRELHSLGPGRVLGDLIDSGTVPVTALTSPDATMTARARLAAAVGSGSLTPVDSPDREVVVVTAGGAAEAAHRVVQLVTDSIPRALGIDPGDIQVVTPVRRGLAGADALNAALRAAFHPDTGTGAEPAGDTRRDAERTARADGNGGARPHAGYAVGDRVLLPTENATGPDEPSVITELDGDRAGLTGPGGTTTVPAGSLAAARPAWAMTIHRAHGSGWPAVVVVLPGEAAGTLSRPLAYTAFTSAFRHLSVVHAAGPALAHAVRTVGHQPRRTRLAALLRETAAETTAEIASLGP